MSATAQIDTFERRVTRDEADSLRYGTHSLVVGYVLWILGFTGAHRFYYGRPISGTLYFCTFGLLGVGWLIDLFLMPTMHQSAERKYVPGQFDYNLAWILLTFLGPFGGHRIYLGKWVTGGLMLTVTAVSTALPPLALLVGAVYLYDYWTLNEQVTAENLAARR